MNAKNSIYMVVGLSLSIILAIIIFAGLIKQCNNNENPDASVVQDVLPSNDGLIIDAMARLDGDSTEFGAWKPDAGGKPDAGRVAEPDCSTNLPSSMIAKILSENPKIACEAINNVSTCDSRRSVESLLPALKTLDEDITKCAQKALDSLQMTSYVLLGWWQSGRKEEQSKALDFAKFLGQLPLLPIFREAARDRDVVFRRNAAVGLQHYGTNSAQAISILAPLVSDPDEGVRQRAVYSLFKLHQPEARQILQERLGSETNPEIKDFMKQLLERDKKQGLE